MSFAKCDTAEGGQSRKRKAPFSEDVGPIEDESTEFKLATLVSLYPLLDQEVIIDALLAADGSIEVASTKLGIFHDTTPLVKRRLTNAVADRQTSLSSYKIHRDVLLPSPGAPSLPITKRGHTVHLYTSEDVALHTPCSIIHNFLSSNEAEDLLKELLEEAPTFEKQTFKLFDRVVQSPHSACFYVESLEEQQKQKTEYLYNGSYLTVRSHAPVSMGSLNRPLISM
jgi:hypothetical protein